MTWDEQAACKGTNPNIWQASHTGRGVLSAHYPHLEHARRICAGCPVGERCLTEVLAYEAEAGKYDQSIRNGTRPADRPPPNQKRDTA